MVMATMSFAECLPFPLDESSFVSVVFVCCVTLQIIMNTKMLRFDTSKFLLIMTSFIWSTTSLNGKYFQQNLIFVAFVFLFRVWYSISNKTNSHNSSSNLKRYFFPFVSTSLTHSTSLFLFSIQTLKDQKENVSFEIFVFLNVFWVCLLSMICFLIPMHADSLYDIRCVFKKKVRR